MKPKKIVGPRLYFLEAGQLFVMGSLMSSSFFAGINLLLAAARTHSHWLYAAAGIMMAMVIALCFFAMKLLRKGKGLGDFCGERLALAEVFIQKSIGFRNWWHERKGPDPFPEWEHMLAHITHNCECYKAPRLDS